MKIHHSVLAIALLSGVAFAAPARADEDRIFHTEEQARQACGNEAVVWVNLDKERYYASNSEHYGKGDGGVYTCEKDAHIKYRPGQ